MDLAYNATSPITVVRQYFAELIDGTAPRLRIAWQTEVQGSKVTESSLVWHPHLQFII